MQQPLRILTHFGLSLIATSLIGLGLVTPASASNNGRIEMTISPAKTTPELKKGQIYRGQFELINSGGVDFKARVFASPYQATNDGYKLEDTTDRSLLHKWIKLDQNEVIVKANQSVTIDYSINVPNDIPNGGQYGIIFAETVNENQAQTSGVAAVSRLGMLIYASTDGQNRLEGNLHSTQIPALQIGSQSKFSFKASNTGNSHFDVDATLTITDLFGNQKFRLNRNKFTVLPDLDKQIDMNWERAPVFALMKVNLQAKALDKQLNETRTVLFISPVFFVVIIAIILILGSSYVLNKKYTYKFKK